MITDAAFARLLDIAAEAGRIALEGFRPGRRTSSRVVEKAGGSPVTDSDLAVDAYLAAALPTALPDAAIVSEESAPHGPADRRRIAIVDPIDGTRAFAEGDPRWCVSIGVVEDGEAIAGVLAVPAMGLVLAARRGGGATRNGAPLPVRTTARPARMIGAPALLAAHVPGATGLERLPSAPSLAFRLIQIATGEADVLIVRPDAHDWDIAGAHPILAEAGCTLRRLDGGALRYGLRDLAQPALLAAPHAIAADLARMEARAHP
jgi:myo-inositol-1(or 4)-monophosphatase